MSMQRTLVTLAVTSALTLIAGCKSEKAPEASEVATQAAPAATSAPSIAKGDDLLGTTCGDYLGMMALANPGEKPTDEQKAAAEHAQDELVNVMLWAHGYATGKGGSVATAEPLNKDWMVDRIGKLAAACKADESGQLRLADAVAKL